VSKVRVGISFDREVMGALDDQVNASLDLSSDRSEIVNAVMKSFLGREAHHDDDDDDDDVASKVRELLITERMRKNRSGNEGAGRGNRDDA
jgi:hypothetical protein